MNIEIIKPHWTKDPKHSEGSDYVDEIYTSFKRCVEIMMTSIQINDQAALKEELGDLAELALEVYQLCENAVRQEKNEYNVLAQAYAYMYFAQVNAILFTLADKVSQMSPQEKMLSHKAFSTSLNRFYDYLAQFAKSDVFEQNKESHGEWTQLAFNVKTRTEMLGLLWFT